MKENMCEIVVRYRCKVGNKGIGSDPKTNMKLCKYFSPSNFGYCVNSFYPEPDYPGRGVSAFCLSDKARCEANGFDLNESQHQQSEDLDLETKAAIFLEENHVSGDAMVAMDHCLDELNGIRGSLYLHGLMAGFVTKLLSERKEK
jgi:hypothetical protein